MKSKFADLGERRDYEWQELHPVLQLMATEAHSLREAWSDAGTVSVRSSRELGDYYETLTLHELATFRLWQEVENMAQEVADQLAKLNAPAEAPAEPDPEAPRIRILGDWVEQAEKWLRERGSPAPLNTEERFRAEGRVRLGWPLVNIASEVLNRRHQEQPPQEIPF